MAGGKAMKDLAMTVSDAGKGNVHLFSAGQAGYIVKSASGRLLGIDLYLSDCVERMEGHMGYKRLLPKILGFYDLRFDVLVATHPHMDHFDIDAIPALMSYRTTRLFCSGGCQELVRRTGMEYYNENITYVRPGDTAECGGFCLRFVRCDHGTGAPDAVGVIVETDGIRIYEAGDTCLRTDYASEIRRTGSVDILIAPVNGAYGNMNEEECAQFCGILKPGTVIPCHYGMFAAHGGDPGRFYEIIKKEYPDQHVYFMAQGEQYTIRET